MRINELVITAAIALATAVSIAYAAAPSGPSVSPADALQQLLDGNQRFVGGKMTHPNQSPERRDEVAKGQHPFAAILACADSRSGPEVLFDRGLGDLFVVRVAGNVLDKVVVESLDYSVTHLGARLVVVMGHTKCGAVIAAVEGHDEPGDVGPMLRELNPAVAAAKGMSGDPVANAVRENVILSVKRLKESPELADKVKSGDVKVVGAVYDLETGKVEVLPE